MSRYDLIVVGGGPAGLMAAGQAARRGLKVMLLEKMHHPARKLGITGKGRCNLTNTANPQDFLKSFGNGEKFMRFVLGRFNNMDLINFFEKLNVATIVERGGRVFPADQEARIVVKALINWAKNQGVTIRPNSKVHRIIARDNRVRGACISSTDLSKSEAASELSADNVLIATGGASYPATGSTGDGYAMAQDMGHAVVPVHPGLVPLETAGSTAQKMQGLSLRNVQAELFIQGKMQARSFGEMLFTHFGVSGPIILSMSKTAVQSLDQGLEVSLLIDLKPAVSHALLKSRIARVMHQHGKKKLINILKELFPLKMIPVFLEESGLDPDKQGNQISALDQKIIRMWCKQLQMKVTGYRSFNEAIITSGGIKLLEVNPKTMESRIVKGLFFAGEVLDLDADTGGFNLQAAFSTGWVAGNSVPGSSCS